MGEGSGNTLEDNVYLVEALPTSSGDDSVKAIEAAGGYVKQDPKTKERTSFLPIPRLRRLFEKVFEKKK